MISTAVAAIMGLVAALITWLFGKRKGEEQGRDIERGRQLEAHREHVEHVARSDAAIDAETQRRVSAALAEARSNASKPITVDEARQWLRRHGFDVSDEDPS